MRKMLLAVLFLALPCSALAQSDDVLRDTLRKLTAQSNSLMKDLPSITCKETGLSQVIKNGKVKKEVRFVADVRSTRLRYGAMDETLTVTEVDGKPFNGHNMNAPYAVQGGFDESLYYFQKSKLFCFRFSLTGKRLDFDVSEGETPGQDCVTAGAPKGFATLDADGYATHIERKVDHKMGRKVGLSDYTSIDMVQTELDGKIYPLSTKTVNEEYDGSTTKHFEATYTDCRLFKAKVTLHPGQVVPDDSSAPHP